MTTKSASVMGGGAVTAATSLYAGYALLSAGSSGMVEEEPLVVEVKGGLVFTSHRLVSNKPNKWNIIKGNSPCTDKLLTGLKRTSTDKGKTDGKVTLSFNSQEKAEGCLFVNWKKTTVSEYWKGVIQWEWVIKKGDDALLVQGFTRSSEKEKSLDIVWGAWVLKKSSSSWSVEEHKKHGLLALTDKLTKGFSKDETSGPSHNVWGFYPGNLEKSCPFIDETSNGCNFKFGKEESTTTDEKVWLFKEGEGAEKTTDWSSNFEEWWNHFLNDKLDITSVKNLTGTWTEVDLTK